MTKIDYGVDIDMNDNHILNVAIQTVNSLPGSGVLGKMIYYTTDSTVRVWDGTQWMVIAKVGDIPSATTTTPKMDGTASAGSETAWAKGDHIHPTDTSREATANKNVASGYAGLDANSKINVTQIPTGATADKIPLLKGTITDGKVLKYSSSDGGFVEASISAVLTYKGSCTYATLPSSGQVIGDVWNVTDAHGTTPAGTNYAWNGSAWDPLGGDVDLSGYATTTALSNHTTDSDIHVTSAKKSEWDAKTSVYRGTITGDAVKTSFTLTHDLGAIPTVQIFDSSGIMVMTKITATTTTVTVDFNTAVASGTTYKVVCVG